MTEVWKPIKGYEGFYEISNKGNVRSLDRVITLSGKRDGQVRRYRGRPLYPLKCHDCLVVHLQKEGKRETTSLGKLVAQHFLDGYADSGRMRVKYKDGDAFNCCVTNLE